jgi:hypothetical protein
MLATRARRCSTGCSPDATAARSFFAWKTPIPSGRRKRPRPRSSTTCAGLVSIGTRGRTWAAPTRHTDSRTARSAIRRRLAFCWRTNARTTASAHPKSSTPRGTPRWRGTAAELQREMPSVGSGYGRDALRGELAAIRFAVPDLRDVTFSDLVRGEVTFSTGVIRRSCHCPVGRPAWCVLRRRG